MSVDTNVPTLKKIYRFAAGFTLLLLASNVLLPAGAAAVNLYCDFEMEGHTMHQCCDGSEMDHHETDDCLILSFCEQVIDGQQSDMPAVMQHVKSMAGAELTDEIAPLLQTTDRLAASGDKSVVEYEAPSLFLMNSVFLN